MKQFLLVLIAIFCVATVTAQNSWDSIQVKNQQNKNELKVYPNPCKINKVTVDFNMNEIAEVRLVSITGKEVYRKEYFVSVYKTQVQLQNIPNGIYLVQVKTTNNKRFTKKLIVAKQ